MRANYFEPCVCQHLDFFENGKDIFKVEFVANVELEGGWLDAFHFYAQVHTRVLYSGRWVHLRLLHQ